MIIRIGFFCAFLAVGIIVASGSAVSGTPEATGSTGIVTGSTASTASSTTGGTTGGSDAGVVIKMEEASGTTSYDSVTTHELRVQFQIPSTVGTSGTGTVTSSTTGSCLNTTGSYDENAERSAASVVDVQETVNSPQSEPYAGTGTGTTGGSTTATGTGTTGGGDTGPYYRWTSTGYIFAVDADAVDALVNDTVSETTTSGTITDLNPTPNVSFTCTLIQVHPGDYVSLYTSPTTHSINAFTIRVDSGVEYYKNSSGDEIDDTAATSVTTYRDDYTLSRTTATAVPIDSRRAFGQPNLAGELAGDPNAAEANVQFSGWLYCGGLFAGNSAFNSGDLSGTSRTQLYATLPSTTDVVCETATLVNVGEPPVFSTPANLSAVTIGSGDTYSGTSASDVTWATRWTISGGLLTSGAIDFTSYPASEYANFEFPTYQTSTSYTGLVSISSTDESSVVSAGTNFWQYFAGAAYLSSLSSDVLPFTDGQPRIWLCDLTFSDEWLYMTP